MQYKIIVGIFLAFILSLISCASKTQKDEKYSGGVDKEQIRRKIFTLIPQVKKCYSDELTVNPGIQGKIVVRFQIENNGNVSEAKTLSTTMGNGKVEICINDVIKSAQFSKPQGNSIAIVDYPFVFSAREHQEEKTSQ